MVLFLICAFFFSSVWQIRQSKSKFGYFLNPITLFVFIFFLHNWSLSLSKIFFDNLTWYTPNHNPEEYQSTVLAINLSCLWCFYIGCNAVVKVGNNFTSKIYNLNVYKYLYYILTIITVAQNFRGFGAIYGEGQASNAIDAFNPIAIFLLSRVVWGAIYAMNSTKRDFLIIICLELIVAIVTGGRKSIIIILFSGILSHYEFFKLKINPIKLVGYFFVGLLIVYFVIFIAAYREASSVANESFINKSSFVFEKINDSFIDNIIGGINIANSEAVQIWVYQLIDYGELKMTFGLTYVQGILNTVVLRPFQGDLINYQAAYYFKNVAYPTLNSQGYDFTFTAEGILNWGWFAGISYLILGLVVGKIYTRRSKSNFYTILYILIMSLSYVCFRTDSTTFFRYISFFLLSFPVFKILGLIRLTGKH